MSLTMDTGLRAKHDDHAEPATQETRFTSVNQKRRLLVLRGLAVVLGLALLASGSGWSPAMQSGLWWAGMALGITCIAGRLWSILYIGPVKSLKLVRSGPFAMVRNPLYFFSSIGAAGIGLMFGSIGAAIVLFIVAAQVFTITARKEERFLERRFGAEYRAYCRDTPRFWPNLRRLNLSGDVHVDLTSIGKTLVDGMWFLAPLPIVILLRDLQLHDVATVFFKLF